jgi:hypothetical protein
MDSIGRLWAFRAAGADKIGDMRPLAPHMKATRLLGTLALLPLFLAASCAAPAPSSGGATGGADGDTGRGGASGTGGAATGGAPGSGGSAAGTGGAGSGGASGTGGSPGTGGAGSGGTPGTGGSPGTPDASPMETGGEPSNPAAVAGTLDGAFLEPKCTDTPRNGFCHHSGVIEQKLKMGGEAGKTYDVTLKVWAIAEGIKFSGGQPAGDHFYTGGMSVTPRYSPCGLKVGETTYWLNRKEDRANDKIYKFEYTTPAIKIPGQADLLLYCIDDASKHISINNPPPLGNAANGRHTIEMPPERLKAKLGMQPYAFTFIYLEAASATAAP